MHIFVFSSFRAIQVASNQIVDLPFDAHVKFLCGFTIQQCNADMISAAMREPVVHMEDVYLGILRSRHCPQVKSIDHKDFNFQIRAGM